MSSGTFAPRLTLSPTFDFRTFAPHHFRLSLTHDTFRVRTKYLHHSVLARTSSTYFQPCFNLSSTHSNRQSVGIAVYTVSTDSTYLYRQKVSTCTCLYSTRTYRTDRQSVSQTGMVQNSTCTVGTRTN